MRCLLIVMAIDAAGTMHGLSAPPIGSALKEGKSPGLLRVYPYSSISGGIVDEVIYIG